MNRVDPLHRTPTQDERLIPRKTTYRTAAMVYDIHMRYGRKVLRYRVIANVTLKVLRETLTQLLFQGPIPLSGGSSFGFLFPHLPRQSLPPPSREVSKRFSLENDNDNGAARDDSTSRSHATSHSLQ